MDAVNPDSAFTESKSTTSFTDKLIVRLQLIFLTALNSALIVLQSSGWFSVHLALQMYSCRVGFSPVWKSKLFIESNLCRFFRLSKKFCISQQKIYFFSRRPYFCFQDFDLTIRLSLHNCMGTGGDFWMIKILKVPSGLSIPGEDRRGYDKNRL